MNTNEPKALRFNEGKPPLHHILDFSAAVAALCYVMQQGAIKYGERNWLLGNNGDHTYLASCLRHIYAFCEGEYYDPDLGTPHLANAAWNLMAIIENNYKDYPFLSPQFNQEEFEKQYKDTPKKPNPRPKPEIPPPHDSNK